MKFHFYLFSLIVFPYSFLMAQTPPIWGDLKKGKYAVGFKVLYEFDYSRVYHNPHPVTGKPFPEEAARPIRIFIWYPAMSAKTNKMKYKDYINLKAADSRFDNYNNALNCFDNWATINWTDGRQGSLDKILESQVEAMKDGKPVPEKFPLIVHYAGANSRRNENIPLWEYLASNGYVVMTIPELAAIGDVSMELWPFSVTGRETIVRDTEFAMSKLHDSSNIDFTNIGTIGFSFGSVFAMRAAMLNFNIKALVTFDGNVNNKNGQNILESFYNPKIKVDWLNIYRASYDDLDLKVFNELKYTNRSRISYTSAIHGDFEDFAMACSLLPSQTPAFALKERDVITGKKNYETACELTLHFFDKSLKANKGAEASFNNIIQNRKIEGIIKEYECRKAAKIIDEEDLAHIIIYYGIEEAEKTYKEIIGSGEYEVLVTSESLMSMAKALRMGGRRLIESNDVLFFLERNFPFDTGVQIELARNYMELKRPEEAKHSLQKVIKRDIQNKDALELLQKIGN